MTLGSDFRMRDAMERVVGTVEFVSDLELLGMVHAQVLRSPYAHAVIRAIDASAAREAPGVITVLTGEDLRADTSVEAYYGVQRRDQPILAIDKVRQHGDPVAVVVAETAAEAAEALYLIEVDYEELPAVMSAVDAGAPGAPVLHEQWPDNTVGVARMRHGDIEGGWAASDRVYEHTYTVPSASHVPLESFVSVASWDGDRLELWTSAQAPYAVRRVLTQVFGLDPRQVRVRTKNLGGAFGSKGQVKIEPLVAYAARAAGRPVRLMLSREEAFFTVARHAADIRIRTGVKLDGTLVARQVEVTWNAGAYATMSPLSVTQGMARAAGPYRIPHVWVDSYARYTNTVPTGPFRGAMTTQVCWAYESHLDEIALDLGIDPVELRRRNLLRDGDLHPTGQVMHDVHFRELLDNVAGAIEWDHQAGPSPAGTVRAKGVAVMLKSTLTPSRSEARAELDTDGMLTVHSSSVEMGQGVNATITQLAADRFGIPTEHVRVPFPDTDVTPFDTTTSSSRSTHAMGTAVRAAVDDLIARLREHAAGTLGVAVSDVIHADGAVRAASDPQWVVRDEQIVRDSGRPHLAGTGVFQSEGGLDPETGQGVHSVHWHQGAAGVEVEVDLETGHVTVLRCHAAVWAGRVISSHRARQQNEGCALWGVGQGLIEQLSYENGQILNPNLSEYPILSIRDTPAALTTSELGGTDDAELHGIGEMTVPVLPPALGNAVARAAGIRVRDLPITAERVLRLLLKAVS